MSDNFSTQLPHPPKLEPLAQPKGPQFFSTLLIAAGLILLAVGGWMFLQSQFELSHPPARIIEVSLADLTPSPTVPPSPSPSHTPTQPISGQTLGDVLIFKPTPTPRPTQPPPPTFTLQPPTEAPTETNTAPPPQPTAFPTDTATPEPTLTPTPEPVIPPTNTPTPPPPAAEAALSLEDNPLVVDSTNGTPSPPSAPADTAIESPLTRIVAESIGLDSPVVGVGWRQEMRNGTPVNIWVVADYAAGWHKNSALPGQGGNIVLSGHHNINGEIFRYTVDLNVGDLITLYEGDQAFNYTVVDKFILKDKGEPDAVRRENAKWIGPFNEERLTLITCWPYTNNTHRAVVIAKPVVP